MLSLLLVVLGVGAVLFLVLVVGGLVLLKLGVIAHYATKPDRPEDKGGEYGLDQSRDVRDQGE